MDAYFKEGNAPQPPKQEALVHLSQFARPAFEVLPDGPIPISQYGKQTPKKK
jgi:hypothetical protein